jgi:Tfp pilus assembly protein PilF
LFIYDASLHVPLIVAWPGVLGPRVAVDAVRLIDLAPTVTDIAGIGGLDGADGRTLRPLLEGRGPRDEPPPSYAESYFPQFFMQWAPLRAIEASRWKYIEAPEPELYDLQADPGETRNLAASETARVTGLKRALDGISAAGGGRQASTPLTGEARERLVSLGYLSASAPKAVEPGTVLPDPKRMVTLYQRLLEGNRALSEGHASQAAGLARDVLAKDRGNAFAHLLLGRAALASGQHQQAVEAFRAYLAVVPGSAEAHHWLGLAHLRLGDRARALAEEEAALAIDPRMVPAVSLKAGLLFSTGRKEEGVQVLRDAVERDPSNPALRVELADLLTDARRYTEAEAEFRQVIAARPRDSRSLLGLGLVLGATKRPADALEPLNQAVEAEPLNSDPRYARAEILEGLVRLQEARADYAQVAKEAERPDLRQVAARKIKEMQ